MEKASGLKRFAWICLILAVVASCGVIIIWRTCCRPCPPPPIGPGPENTVHGQIIVEDSEIAAWTTINNYVNPASAPDPIRQGVLFQAGFYEGGSFQCNEIAFLDAAGDEISTIPCDPGAPFRWVNAVAPLGLSVTPVISSADAADLGPSGTDTTCCSALYDCIQGDPASVCGNWPDPLKCPADDALGCLRSLKLHSSLEVMTMLTYWRANSGYSIETSNITKTVSIHGVPTVVNLDKYTFSLMDAFGVKVYKCNYAPNGRCTLVEDTTVPVAGTHTIVFRSEPSGDTQVGLHTTPPWPTKKP